MINIKYCKKCKRAFDIGTNYDLCSKCRNKTLIQLEGGIKTMSDNSQLDSWDGLLTNYLKAEEIVGDIGSEAVVVVIGATREEKNLNLNVEYNGNKYVFTCNVTNMVFLMEHGISNPKQVIGKKLTLRKTTAMNPQLKKEVPTLRICKVD